MRLLFALPKSVPQPSSLSIRPSSSPVVATEVCSLAMGPARNILTDSFALCRGVRLTSFRRLYLPDRLIDPTNSP